MLGYILIALALVLFVQCKHVYPQLLLARLLFSFGGSAASTMVTAVLPAISGVVDAEKASNEINGHRHEQSADNSASAGRNTHEDESTPAPSVSISSELTITPARYQSCTIPAAEAEVTGSPPALDFAAASSRMAGYVGMFAGCGALLSLILFLPLPERLQKHGYSPESALQYSYYVVAVVALFISAWCAIGLQGLREQRANFTRLFKRIQRGRPSSSGRSSSSDGVEGPTPFLWQNFHQAVSLGFRRADIGLGYVGGFVARASSVAISLFVPLLVNALFRSSGICGQDDEHDVGGLPGLRRKCSQAYILAAELTGVSQLVALLCAPMFGYASAKLGRRQGPLMFASVAGIIGYILIATRFKIETHHQKGNVEAFLAMCLIGVSQIGAIVCSLGALGGAILKRNKNGIPPGISPSSPKPHTGDQENRTPAGEGAPLLPKAEANPSRDLIRLKGSIAGIYSLYGGAGILLLTKLGGLLFDRVSFAAPFYIMAIFNSILLVLCILLATWSLLRSKEAA